MPWPRSSTGVHGNVFQLSSAVGNRGTDKATRGPEHPAFSFSLYGDKLFGSEGDSVNTRKMYHSGPRVPLIFGKECQWQPEEGTGRQAGPEARAGEEWGFLGLGGTLPPPPLTAHSAISLPHLFRH